MDEAEPRPAALELETIEAVARLASASIEGPAFGRKMPLLALAAIILMWAPSAIAVAPPKTFQLPPTSMRVAELPDWLRANTDIPPASLVSLIKNVATILVDRGTPNRSGVRTVVARREALSDFGASVLDGRSELVSLEVDCNASQYRLVSRDIHSGNGMTGPDHLIVANSAMASVPSNTDLAFLVRAVCDPTYQPPLAQYLAATAAAPIPSTQQAQAAPPPPPVARQPVAAPQAQAALPPPPAPRPQRQTGRFVAQIGASPSQSLARMLLADVTRRVPEIAGMPTTVARALVKDAVVYRVTIDGFSTSAAAEALCVRLRAANSPCWVR